MWLTAFNLSLNIPHFYLDSPLISLFFLIMRRESINLSFCTLAPSREHSWDIFLRSLHLKKKWRYININICAKQTWHWYGWWHHVCGQTSMSSRDQVVSPYNHNHTLRRVALVKWKLFCLFCFLFFSSALTWKLSLESRARGSFIVLHNRVRRIGSSHCQSMDCSGVGRGESGEMKEGGVRGQQGGVEWG